MGLKGLRSRGAAGWSAIRESLVVGCDPRSVRGFGGGSAKDPSGTLLRPFSGFMLFPPWPVELGAGPLSGIGSLFGGKNGRPSVAWT